MLFALSNHALMVVPSMLLNQFWLVNSVPVELMVSLIICVWKLYSYALETRPSGLSVPSAKLFEVMIACSPTTAYVAMSSVVKSGATVITTGFTVDAVLVNT